MTKHSDFENWISNLLQPCCIVYSSHEAKNIISKNSLTPSEFFRPFGDFLYKTQMKSPFDESTQIKPIKLDFIDSESFHAIPQDKYYTYVQSLMNHPNIHPKWKANYLKHPQRTIDSILNNYRVSKAFPWCDAFEQTVFELLKCQKTEMFQQPLASFYLCSVNDDNTIIDNLFNKENIPPLLNDNVYITPEAKVLIVLIDKSNANNNSLERLEEIKLKYKNNFYITSLEINSDGTNENDNSDMWKRYKYNIDLYSPNESNINTNDIQYGKYISNNEIETNKNVMYNLFIEYICPIISNKVEQYIKETKDEFKRQGFLYIFQKDKPPEYDKDNIYILNKIEKQCLYAIMMFFYFRNYSKAIELLIKLSPKIKAKSRIHYYYLKQLKGMCIILSGESLLKESFHITLFTQYLENKLFMKALRLLIIIFKYSNNNLDFEQSMKIPNYLQVYQRYLNANQLSVMNNSETFLFYIYRAMIWEKKAIRSLFSATNEVYNNKRHFLLHIYKSAIYYYFKLPLGNLYILHSFGIVISLLNMKSYLLFEKNENILSSFSELKNRLYGKLAKICNDMNYIEEGFIFSRLNLELTAHILMGDQSIEGINACQLMNMYINKLKEIKQNESKLITSINHNDLYTFNIIDIDNPSLYVIEHQDKEISLLTSSTTNAEMKWEKSFKKYVDVDAKQRYAHLDDKDIRVLKYLDNIISDNNPSFNSFHKKMFTANVGEYLHICFDIRNRLNVQFAITSIKLLYKIIGDDKESDSLFEQNTINECILPGNETKSIQITFTCKCPTVISVIGVEITLFHELVLKHLFSSPKENYLYKQITPSSSQQESNALLDILNYNTYTKEANNISTVSNYKKQIDDFRKQTHVLQINKRKEIIYELIPKENNICISYPLGTHIICYRYQCVLYPIVIANNTNVYKIKNFTVFICSSNHNNNSLLLTLKPFYSFNIRLNPTNKQTTIYIPLYSTEISLADVQVVIKFKDERKKQYIEINRFTFQVTVLPSFEFTAEKKINMVKEPNKDEYKEVFVDCLLNIDNVNYKQLTKLQMNDVFIGSNVRLEENDNVNKSNIDEWNYDIIQHKCYKNLTFGIKYYKHHMNDNNMNTECLMEPDDPHLNEYLINVQQQSDICCIYNTILNTVVDNKETTIMFTWKCHETNNECQQLEGLFILNVSDHSHKTFKTDKTKTLNQHISNCNIKLTQTLLQNIIENICIVTPSFTHISTNHILITLTVSFDSTVLNCFNEISSYDIFITDSTDTPNPSPNLNLNWFGITKYSYINTNKEGKFLLHFLCEAHITSTILPLNYIGITFKFNSKSNDHLSKLVFQPKYIELYINE